MTDDAVMTKVRYDYFLVGYLLREVAAAAVMSLVGYYGYFLEMEACFAKAWHSSDGSKCCFCAFDWWSISITRGRGLWPEA